uniref:porin n=1 Tax=Tabrizicola sp. TaxID=2005166 RepID=UPI00286BBEF7
MKRILLATTLLAASSGFAAAEITLSGDARMGIIDDFGTGDTAFTSRARVKFTMSGETDGGL